MTKRDLILYVTDPETDEQVEVLLPFKWEICSACDGHGKSSAYLGAYTRDEWNEMDYEWQEDYMAGRFDRACECCEGGKVKVADFSRMTKEQKKLWRQRCQADADYEAECRAERRAFCCD